MGFTSQGDETPVRLTPEALRRDETRQEVVPEPGPSMTNSDFIKIRARFLLVQTMMV